MPKGSVHITFGSAPATPGGQGSGRGRAAARGKMPGILAFLLLAASLTVGVLLAATIVVALLALAGVGLLVGVGWAIVRKVQGRKSEGKRRFGMAMNPLDERIACPSCGLVLEIPPEEPAGGTLTCPSCNNLVSLHGTISSQS